MSMTSGAIGGAAEQARLQTLESDECWRLLRSQLVGRLAVARRHEGPLVVPVNYAVDRDMILIRSDPGTKLSLAPGSRVSFQVDDIDAEARSGWSVLATGTAYDATGWDIDRGGLQAWAAGPKENWIRVVIDQVSGRRLGGPDPV